MPYEPAVVSIEWVERVLARILEDTYEGDELMFKILTALVCGEGSPPHDYR